MSENSDDSIKLKCPFRATIMTRSFGCTHASEVTRREGPDIACDSEQLNGQCVSCFTELKNHALPAMGYTDDLTSMPASVIQKIQFGGLLALQSMVAADKNSDSVEDIASLIEASDSQFGDVGNYPFSQCVDAIKNYKMKRRRGR